MKVLILGAGNKKYDLPGATITRVDMNANVNPDVVHNLDQMPYPFEDSQFDQIILDHVLEHLDNIPAVMDQLHRIARNNAKITIVVPYFRSILAHIDPTHRHCFTWDTLSYFNCDHPYHKQYAMTNNSFKMNYRLYNDQIDQTLFQKLLIKFAHKYPRAYERHISQVFPLETLTYNLTVVK
jgi:predicted SAM-dependent methyltransferase